MIRLVLPLMLLAFAAPTAKAHAFLDRAVPAVGSVVSAPPPELQLFFTQELEPAFSGATLSTGDGRPVATGAASVDPRNRAVDGIDSAAARPRALPGELARGLRRHPSHRRQLYLRRADRDGSFVAELLQAVRFVHFAAVMVAFGIGAFRLYAFAGDLAVANAPARHALDRTLTRMMMVIRRDRAALRGRDGALRRGGNGGDATRRARPAHP